MQLARIVNKGMLGEAEHAVLQIESNKMFEFSKISNEGISNADISHPTIKRILANGQVVNITFDENDNVTLHF
jgi:hypothetical protein